MKRNLLLCMALLGFLLCAVRQTQGAFTAQGRTTNVLTTGNVEIELIEQQKDADGTLKLFDQTVSHPVVPGDVYSKIPTVENTGSEPCYVRVYLRTQGLQDAVQLGFDIGENWLKEDAVRNDTDGWYRYTKVLPSGTSTEPLFTTVAFPFEMGNEYIGVPVQVQLQAQAVQVEYNEIASPKGETVLDVTDWPAVQQGGIADAQ